MLLGVDLSSFQPDIDWPLIERVGVLGFAIAKVSEGTAYVNPFAKAQHEGARVSGLVVGSYHFCRPSLNSGRQEAEYFLSHVGTIQPGHLLAADLEDPDVPDTADLHAYALDFLQTVEREAGFKPLLYSGAYYMEPHNLIGHADLADNGLWLALYQSGPWPKTPKPWPFLCAWQYTSDGQVPGIAGKVDLNIANVASKEQLMAYGRPR